MNATFRLSISCPSTGTRVLTGLHCLGARPATNAGVTIIMQRIVRQVILLDMFPDLITRPCRKRIELDHLIGIVPFDKFCVGAESRLVAADAGDPGIVVGKELSLRDDLPD